MNTIFFISVPIYMSLTDKLVSVFHGLLVRNKNVLKNCHVFKADKL